MKNKLAWLGVVAATALSGCDAPPVAQNPATTPAPVVAPPVVVPPVVAPADTTPAPMPVVAPQVVTPTETVKAEAGVTGKGTTYGGGVITESVRQYFRTGERAVFEIQLPYAMKLYKAAHDDKAPQSHDEYWREIIQANSLEGKLPKLPPGHTYVYDPMTEDLMVRRPQGTP